MSRYATRASIGSRERAYSWNDSASDIATSASYTRRTGPAEGSPHDLFDRRNTHAPLT
ncbi:hypothetical protein GCM10009661_32370 [Catellatospora chokoriensis]|uniref:Uncharacterized protein n=1 Tax=Catellatospora chokoriensis TaxID=310353 RepID=A0A8J3JUK7_9ACTN|nr:hypothetical protein Cch02nite_47960 [Catellatospora chokoriensis]